MRTMLLLAVAVVLAAGPSVRAQGARGLPKGSPAEVDQRLKRIEGQLAEVVKHLDDMRTAAKMRAGAPGGPGPAAQDPPPVKIYVLKHANAQDLAVVLRELFQQRRLSLAVDPRTNSILAASDLHETIEGVISRLDVPVDPKLRLKKEGEPTKNDASLESLRSLRDQARVDLEQRRDRLAWAEKMLKKGFLAESTWQAEQSQVRAAEAALRKIEAELPKPVGAKP